VRFAPYYRKPAGGLDLRQQRQAVTDRLSFGEQQIHVLSRD
jgi:hypothetical protein